MGATSIISSWIINVPRNETKISSTSVGIIEKSNTSLPINCKESEYTDAQFYADLSKASKQLDMMERKALKDHAQGKTRKFPV